MQNTPGFSIIIKYNANALPCLSMIGRSHLFNLVSNHCPFACFALITRAFLPFWYVSGPLHFLSSLLDTSSSADRCLTDSLTSFKCLLKCHLPRETPKPLHSCHSLSLVVLHIFFTRDHIVFLSLFSVFLSRM